MAYANARQQYLKTQVETATKEQLVVMLFDGIVRFTEQARKAIENKEIENSHNLLMRAQAIIMELICTVDREKGGEVANNLLALHAYAFNSLIKCNMFKDVAKIDEVQNIYRELREGWVGAMESLGIGANKTDSTPPPPAPKPTAPISGAPKAAANPTALNAKPAAGSGDLMAKAKPAEAKPAATPVTGYAMGRSATVGSLPQIPAQAPAAKPIDAPAIVKPVVPMNAKHAALLNAYQNGSRSIA